jgi:LEA14-like dessication related protein
VLALLLAGCAHFGRQWTTPEVSLVDIRLQEIKVLEATFSVDLRVLNPNDTALELSGLDCEIEINGQHLARGVAPVAARVEPYGTVIVPLELYASMLDMAGALIDTMHRAAHSDAVEPVDYRVAGRIGLKAGGFRTPSLSFENRGKIDLQALARP